CRCKPHSFPRASACSRTSSACNGWSWRRRKPEGKRMRFLVLVKGPETLRGRQPPAEMMDVIMQLGRDAAKNGVKVEPGALLPTTTSARFRIDDRKLSVTDGPFTEAKEVVGGWAFYECDTWEQAYAATKAYVELHLKYWPEWTGECELRQVVDGPPMRFD